MLLIVFKIKYIMMLTVVSIYIEFVIVSVILATNIGITNSNIAFRKYPI